MCLTNVRVARLLYWIGYGPASVSCTVLAGIDTAPSRPTGAESLQLLFAKKHTGSKLASLSAAYPLEACGVGSSLRFRVWGRKFDEGAGKLVAFKLARVLFTSRCSLDATSCGVR